MPTSFGKLKASLTVEAALAMTLFLFAVISLLNFFFVLRTQIQIQTALEQTGNYLTALPEEASLATASLLFRQQLEAVQADTSLVEGGSGGISLAHSSVMGHEPLVDLVAVYQVHLPFFPEGTATLNLVQRSRKHAFGEAVFSDAEPTDYVYKTPHGTVYHESMYCTYIRPKTQAVEYAYVSELRNQNGGRYTDCSFCCDGETARTVWITQWGSHYHMSSNCRGIWHQVEQVSRYEVKDMRACSKCGTGDQPDTEGSE